MARSACLLQNLAVTSLRETVSHLLSIQVGFARCLLQCWMYLAFLSFSIAQRMPVTCNDKSLNVVLLDEYKQIHDLSCFFFSKVHAMIICGFVDTSGGQFVETFLRKTDQFACVLFVDRRRALRYDSPNAGAISNVIACHHLDRSFRHAVRHWACHLDSLWRCCLTLFQNQYIQQK